MRDPGDLLDLVYETVLDSDLWVPVLERTADMFGGNSAWLSRISMEDGTGTGVIARIDPVMPQRYLDHYANFNPFAIKPRPHEYMSRWTPAIKTDADFIAKEDLHAHEYYNDFMRPQDVDHVLIVNLMAQDLDVCSVNINRSTKGDPFSAADMAFARTLHPHLIRAFKLGTVFSTRRLLDDGREIALDQSGQAVFVLDPQGRIRHINSHGEALLLRRKELGVVAGKLVAKRAEAARALQALIGIAASPDAAVRRGGSLALPSSSGGSPLAITVAPLPAERLPLFPGDRSVLICIMDLDSELRLPDRIMQHLFALTDAEARVALALLDGATPQDIARRFDVSVNTVRSQMSRIFEKTGAAGQGDLIRLMTRLAHGR